MLCLDPLTSVRAAVCFSPHEMYVTLWVLRAASSVGSPVSGVVQEERERERERRSTYVQINQDLTSLLQLFSVAQYVQYRARANCKIFNGKSGYYSGREDLHVA